MIAIPAWLLALGPNLAASIADGRVWRSIAAALVIGAVALAIGIWVTRKVGLLDEDSQSGETIGVGVASGILIISSVWAAVSSGGRSTFMPIALVFVVAIAIALQRKRRNDQPIQWSTVTSTWRYARLGAGRALVPAILCGCLFLLASGFLYGATMAPSPRDGVQPVEFMDEAYYSILGRDAGQTGVESIYSPSGFETISGLPTQTWYHWGEAWLSAVAITTFGVDPIFARHYVALPLILLAAAALTGTLVRRLSGTRSVAAFIFGAGASLLLAPLPFPQTFFGAWATGLVFGVSMYGMAVVCILLASHILLRDDHGLSSTAARLFSGAVIASVVPAHIVIALLAIIGLAGVLVLRFVVTVARERRLPPLPQMAGWGLAVPSMIVVATIAWGLATDHGIGASGQSTNVPAFNASWRESVVLTSLGFGPFLLAPVGWAYSRERPRSLGWILVGTIFILVVGALAWGFRLSDFTMFHVFYGGIAVFAVPVVAAAIWILWLALRTRGQWRLAMVILVLAGAQIAYGIVPGIQRLQLFGPHDYAPVPVAVLYAIEHLPSGGKLAYACNSLEEIGFFWDPRLVSIDAHTDHRIVPMCFQAEYFGPLNGEATSPDLISPLFRLAPQRAIFPSSEASPSPEVVAGFLKANGISFLFADAEHPNSLIPGAIEVAASGDFRVLRIP